jgi:hypothetical protein
MSREAEMVRAVRHAKQVLDHDKTTQKTLYKIKENRMPRNVNVKNPYYQKSLAKLLSLGLINVHMDDSFELSKIGQKYVKSKLLVA